MIPWVLLGEARVPTDGKRLSLYQRADEFSIRLSGVGGELMNSRVHGSEEARDVRGRLLARSEFSCTP